MKRWFELIKRVLGCVYYVGWVKLPLLSWTNYPWWMETGRKRGSEGKEKEIRESCWGKVQGPFPMWSAESSAYNYADSMLI